MSKFTKKSRFIGIDISQKTIDVALVEQSNVQQFQEKKFENSLKGFDHMHTWLTRKKISMNDVLFCMEHTGTYGLLLFAWLTEKGFDFNVEPGLQIKRSIGIARGKNDKVDARRIAIYALEHKYTMKPYVLPAENLIKIKQLLTYRDQLIRTRTSFKLSLKNHSQYQQISKQEFVTEDIDHMIEDFDKKVDFIEKQVHQIINSDTQLKKNFQLSQTVKGIGFVIAAYMLVTTNNYTSFTDGRKYACYAGMAPFEHSSGTSINGKTMVSHLAHKKLKSLFSNGANSAYKWDPEIRNYYLRKKKEGKDHKLIINSIGCKLVNRVFAVIKRQTPYVSMYQQNFS